MSIQLLLYIIAAIFLALATFGVSPHPRVSFGWAGLCLWLIAYAFAG